MDVIIFLVFLPHRPTKRTPQVQATLAGVSRGEKNNLSLTRLSGQPSQMETSTAQHLRLAIRCAWPRSHYHIDDHTKLRRYLCELLCPDFAIGVREYEYSRAGEEACDERGS